MLPILFSIGSLQFHSSPVFAALSSLAAALYFRRHASRAGLTPEDYWNVMLLVAPAALLGAVLLAWAPAFERAGWLPVFRGGSFYGALWGSLAALWLAARWRGLRAWPMTDLLAGAAMLGLAVMRVGCLFNGCCHGSPTDSAFSVVLADPRCAADPACLGVPLHPCQVYESAGCLLIFLVVYGPLFRRVRDGSLPAGASFVGAYAAYALLRSLTDPLRADAVLCPGLQGLSAAQALSMSSFAAFWLLWERAQSGVLSWRRIGETAVRAEDICLPPLLLSASCVGLSLALTRGPSPAAASAVLGLIEAWALLTRGRALEGPLRPAEVLLPLAAAGLFAAFNLLPLVPEGWDASLAAGPLLPALTAAGAAVFLLGVVLAAASIAHLGSSFGLVVQVRGIVKTGPYRFTRHPIYLGYCLIAAGSCLLRPMLSTVLLSAAACAALAARARLEEARLAASCAEYREYLAVPTRGLLRKT